jgi:hypothetical protein
MFVPVHKTAAAYAYLENRDALDSIGCRSVQNAVPEVWERNSMYWLVCWNVVPEASERSAVFLFREVFCPLLLFVLRLKIL